MIGRLVDGRYQVRSRIARGGMATVYLATDLRLERRVALKVMHGHLADDSQYRARFIQEARSAARLAHPNVVNVYDQGQDADTAYLVMEYLPGITLRDLLDEHRTLTTDQAFDIMEAVLSGLAAAHKNGIVHRDLKPENVLLADDGRIKIGDFGLARAATANTATGNALLGTIAYLSPELVTRGIADTRSDIYAVGIMLYEMLAGEQPFKGEQPFQIAHQHANDTVGTPSSKNPEVPAELDELVLWATARDPDQRPHDAKTMLEQLLDTQAQLSTGVPTAATSVQRTMVMPSDPGRDASNDATQIITPRVRQRTGPVVADSTSALAEKSGKRRARGFWLFALVVLLAALAGGTGWFFNAGPGALIAVPAVAGQDVATATATLTAAELRVSETIIEDFDPSATVGSVIGTDPATGASVGKDSVVSIITSKGPRPLPFPAVAGIAEADAVTQLAGFAVQESRYEFVAEVPNGTVIRALGADDADITGAPEYGELQPVTLVVSRGAVPDVGGLTVAEATARLEAVGLTAGAESRAFSDKVRRDGIISATPTTDPVVPQTAIDFVVSDGVDLVGVPDVSGQQMSAAKAALEGAGFTVTFANQNNPLAFLVLNSYEASGTDPEAGTSLKRGSTIELLYDL